MKPTPYPSSNDDSGPAADELAAAWLCERDEGFTPERAEAFAAWCAADPRHAAAVRQIEQALGLLETMPTVRCPLEARFGPLAAVGAGEPGARDRAAASSPAPASRRSRPDRSWAPGLAAALVLGLCGWWFIAAQVAGRDHFVNDTAAPQRLALRDGSTVHLAAHSELRVNFSGGERRVRLEAGLAHFEVAHDAARPFVATAAGVAVRAIGTAFSVQLASAAVEVLVEEGRVEVAPATPAGAAVFTTPPPQLGAGERARIARSDAPATPQIEKVEPQALRQALAWHRRTVVLADVPLEEVVARFNRRNAIQLVLADEALRGRRVGGVLDLDQVEAFVALLERGGDIVTERLGPDEIALRRAR